jgi:hypothetical protein
MRTVTSLLRDPLGDIAFKPSSPTDSEESDNILDWLKWSQPQPRIPGISDAEMVFIVPVLFPGGVRNVTLLFRNIAIARVSCTFRYCHFRTLTVLQILRALMFGKKTVGPDCLYESKWMVHGKCFAKVHGVESVTPAMIALGSILVRTSSSHYRYL